MTRNFGLCVQLFVFKSSTHSYHTLLICTLSILCFSTHYISDSFYCPKTLGKTPWPAVLDIHMYFFVQDYPGVSKIRLCIAWGLRRCIVEHELQDERTRLQRTHHMPLVQPQDSAAEPVGSYCRPIYQKSWTPPRAEGVSAVPMHLLIIRKTSYTLIRYHCYTEILLPSQCYRCIRTVHM